MPLQCTTIRLAVSARCRQHSRWVHRYQLLNENQRGGDSRTGVDAAADITAAGSGGAEAAAAAAAAHDGDDSYRHTARADGGSFHRHRRRYCHCDNTVWLLLYGYASAHEMDPVLPEKNQCKPHEGQRL